MHHPLPHLVDGTIPLFSQAYVDFGTNAPGYGQLQPDNVLAQIHQSYFGPGGCRERELACYAAGDSVDSEKICHKADNFCVCVSSTYSNCFLLNKSKHRMITSSIQLPPTGTLTISDRTPPPSSHLNFTLIF